MNKKEKVGFGYARMVIGSGIAGATYWVFKNELLMAIMIVIIIEMIRINIVLLIFCVLKDKKRYHIRKKRLTESAKKNEQLKSEIGYNRQLIEEERDEKIRKHFCKFGTIIGSLCIYVFVVCVADMSTTKKLVYDAQIYAKAGREQVYKERKSAKKNTEQISVIDEENITVQEVNTIETKKESVKKELSKNAEKKNIRRKKPKKYRFVLKEGKVNLSKNKEIQEVLNIKNLREWVEENGNQKENYSAFNNIPNSLGRTFSDYVAVENDFEEEIQKYKNMEYYDEWKKNAPNSNELDEIISGKRKVATTLQKNEIDNYTVWWSLANDYQNYALEYSVQTTDAEKITFYYMKSIYCCLEVLKFDNDKNVEELIWNYIEQRYKDLLIQDGISQKYREVALEVLDTLDMDAGATID